jgi:transposase
MAREGPKGLEAIPPSGRPSLLKWGQLQRLERLLLKGTRAHGWANGLWSAKRVRDVIRRRFGITYHEEHVRKILRDRLGWTSQKPELRARERDEEEIERWIQKELPRIKKIG